MDWINDENIVTLSHVDEYDTNLRDKRKDFFEKLTEGRTLKFWRKGSMPKALAGGWRLGYRIYEGENLIDEICVFVLMS